MQNCIKTTKMHILQPKHSKLDQKEADELVKAYNISLSQLPKIKAEDPSLPKGCSNGDIIKIERTEGENTFIYFRVVV